MDSPTPILYTQTGCADSGKVRDWLAAHCVPFIERNVTGDESAALELAATGIFATPLLVVGDKQIFGFRPETFTAVLPDRQSGR